MNDHIDLEEEYEQDTEEAKNVLLEIPQQFNQKSLEESIFISNLMKTVGQLIGTDATNSLNESDSNSCKVINDVNIFSFFFLDMKVFI